VPVSTLKARNNGRQVTVGLPANATLGEFGIEMKRIVFMLGRMKIAAGEKGPDRQSGFPGAAGQPPAQNDRRLPVGNEKLMLDEDIIVQFEPEYRPRPELEFSKPRDPIRTDDLGGVALRREKKLAARCFDPGIEPVHEDCSTRWWSGRR